MNTVPEVAEKLRCSLDSIRRLINTPGGIRASKVAGRWLIADEDLTAYLESRANRARPRPRRQRAT